MSDRLVLVVSLWLYDGNIAGFEAFERKAVALMENYGGRIERVIRINDGNPDAPFEVHIISFPDRRAFVDYRAAPSAQTLAQERTTVIERTVVWSGRDGAVI